jgi:Domain of unknown function (DUF932)
MTTVTTSVFDSVRAAFPFTVDKFPLSGPDGMKNTPHYGLFRSDNCESVGVACRKGYEPHTVDDVCALVEAAASAFDGDATARCLFHDGHYVTVEPSAEYRRSVFGTADNIWPRLMIRAGYDGRAFRAQLGFYRDACRNLAMIRTAGRTVEANIRHTTQLRGKLVELRRTFAQLASGWNGVVETARGMESRQVNLADFLRQVYPLSNDATDRTRHSAERRVESIIRRIVRERQHTGRPDLRIGTAGAYLVSAWEAFNGVQGYIQHDMSRHGRPDDYTRAIIALDDAAVSRAQELATAA